MDTDGDNDILAVGIAEEVDSRISDNRTAEACNDNTVEAECWCAFFLRDKTCLSGEFISTKIEIVFYSIFRYKLSKKEITASRDLEIYRRHCLTNFHRICSIQGEFTLICVYLLRFDYVSSVFPL